MKKIYNCSKRADRHRHLLSGWLTALLLLLTPPLGAVAQNARVKVVGTVTDAATSEPVVGATVLVKDTSVGTTTGADGRFAISVPSKQEAVLVISFLGYRTEEVAWNRSVTEVNVALESDAITAEEVVVVGYGSQRKSDITGAISSVSKSRLEDMPASSVSQMLQGAVAGLNFSTNTSGANPDEDNVMLVRGRNSISASNSPLIVVDGSIYNGSLSDFSPNDIKNIEVLKDASSTAIYGARAANGVFLITTKSGQKGKTTVRLDSYVSFTKINNFPELFSVDDYARYKNLQKNTEADYDPDDPDTWALSDYEMETLQMIKDGTMEYVPWSDYIFRTGFSQRHNLSISGGGDKTKFQISGNVLRTKGVVQGDDYAKYSARFNVTTDISKAISVQVSGNYSYADNSGSTPGFADAFNKSPLYRPKNPDGSINIYPGGPTVTNAINPLESYLYDDLNRSYTASLNPNLTVKIPWVKGLKYELRNSFQYGFTDKGTYYPTTTRKGMGTGGRASMSNALRYSLSVDNILTYQRDIKKHAIFLTALYGWEYSYKKTTTLDAEGFPHDLTGWNGVSQALNSITNISPQETVMLSAMFRANYAYDSRYLVTYTIRRDAASVFGENNKAAVFHSFALGWNISNEQFFAPWKEVMNNLKLRFSYGENGNMGISPYQTIAQMDNSNPSMTGSGNTGSSDYVNGSTTAPGLLPATLGLPDLSWETTRGFNIGLDYGFLNNRISGDVNLYSNYTYDLLLNRKISSVNGMSSMMSNVGKTQNRGVEFSIRSVNIVRKNFQWSTDFIFSYNENKILDLYGNGSDDVANEWFLGRPIKSNFDYYITGVWQLDEAELAKRYGAVPGYARYDDYNNDGQYTDDDRRYLGTPEPAFMLSMTNTFKYKGLSLNILLYSALGATKSNTYLDTNWYIARDFWTPTNPTNEVWSANSQSNKYAFGTNVKVKKYENADYLRVKDITIGYELPDRWVRKATLSRVNFYVTFKNPFTITSFGGLDPELGDGTHKPLYKEYIFGVNLAF